MNAKMIFANPREKTAQTIIINAHLPSPLINAGKNPKKNVVHENPTGASLVKPPLSK